MNLLPLRRTIPLIIAVLTTVVGCKPKPFGGNGSQASNPTENHPVSAERGTDSQPSQDDLANFLRAGAPPFARVVDVRMDIPALAPNASPASRQWIFNVRFAFVPTDDLLGSASEADMRAYQAVADELAGLVRWHAAYTKSPYPRLYSDFDLKAPAPPPGDLLLAILHKAGEPLPPVYGKMAAEWQMDHWRFSLVDLDIPEAGTPRATFQAPNVVLGSLEAEKFLNSARDAIAKAKAKKAAIDTSYTADLNQATRPGILYKGQISHLGNVAAAEVRFLASPTRDPQSVGLEVRLPATPGEAFVYSAKLAKQVPLRLTIPSGDNSSTPAPADFEPLPKGDLQLGLVSASGKEGAYNETVPVRMLAVQRHYPPANVWLHLFNHRLEGGLDGGGTGPGGCVLSVQEKP